MDGASCVGDDLACAPGIYAVGECAEHRGKVYGLVAPLWEQTAQLADRLSGRNPNAVYTGSKVSTKLKVMGIDLAVMGEKEPSEEGDEVVSYSEPSKGVYKKLIVRNDRLAGAIVLGDGAIAPALLQTFAAGSAGFGQPRRTPVFDTGVVDKSKARQPESMPDDARVCDCNNVSKAQIIEAVLQGARSIRAVCDATRASTGCGSCRPEVEAIVALACERLEPGSPEPGARSPKPGAKQDRAPQAGERRARCGRRPARDSPAMDGRASMTPIASD